MFIFSYPFVTLPGLIEACNKKYEVLASPLREDFSDSEIEHIYKVLMDMPIINLNIRIRGPLHMGEDVDRQIEQPTNYNNFIQVHALQVSRSQ